ncbi:MAG: uroporphyrinogen-III C-methyltransferase [Burkholderiales bacterium]|jgi:uroporphyrin-III C-methyltransferase
MAAPGAAIGRVYLVGAGPGAPDLLTLRAAHVLAQADVVLTDALVHPDTLSLATRAQIVFVGKRAGIPSPKQADINRMLIDAARRYRSVVRLKGGDPMVFGRAQEEIDALRDAGIAFEVVPGVTAALAASAELQRPLTQRARSRHFVLVTPKYADGAPPNDWVRPIIDADAAAVYMGGAAVGEIGQALLRAGRPGTTPVILARNVSLPDAEYVHSTLAEVAAGQVTVQAPVLILIGETFGGAG